MVNVNVDVNELTKQMKKHTVEDAVFIASAVVAVLGLQQDNISKKEAYSLYGKKWIDDRTDRGMLTAVRQGDRRNSEISYSRFDILALKRAEKGVLDAFDKAIKKQKSLESKIK